MGKSHVLFSLLFFFFACFAESTRAPFQSTTHVPLLGSVPTQPSLAADRSVGLRRVESAPAPLTEEFDEATWAMRIQTSVSGEPATGERTSSAPAAFVSSPPQQPARQPVQFAPPTWQQAHQQQQQETPPQLFQQQQHRFPRKTNVLGNSYGRCGNVCIFTADASRSVVVSLFVLFPVVVFLTSVVQPGDVDRIASIVVIVPCTVLALISMFFAVSCDPGIVRPAAANAPLPIPKRRVLENGTEVDVERVCFTCHVVRPVGSNHCHFCNNCVRDADHHCGVLGSCVAERTFRWFAWFFLWLVPVAAYIFVRSVYYLAKADLGENDETSLGRWRTAAGIGCAIYSGFGGCLVLGQAGMYINMACQGTTMKSMAHQHEANAGAYRVELGDDESSCGCCRLISRLCGSIPKSDIRDDDV